MAVQILCPHCKKQTAPFLNPKNDEITCGGCDTKLENVNHFVKTQLKALKQYREVVKVPFSVKCQKCNREETPKDNGKDIVCGVCGEPHKHLTETFKNMLKMQLPKVKKEV